MDMALDFQVLLVIFIAISIGSFAKGMTGLGLPIFAIPVMSVFFGVERAVIIMVLPSLISNWWLVFIHRQSFGVISDIGPFLAMGLIGGFTGSWMLVAYPEKMLVLFLAICLAAYLIHYYFHPKFTLSKKAAYWTNPLIGFAAATVQGATGISAPIIAPYMQALAYKKEKYVFAVALAFAVFSVSQLVSLIELEALTAPRLTEGVIALIPVILFLPLGVKASRIISQKAFEKALIIVFILMDLGLFYKALT